MSDYISKSALLESLAKYKFGAISNDVEREYTKEMMLLIVGEQPTVDEKEIIRKTVERIISRLEELRMRYFLTIANTGNKEKDVAYENVSNVLNGVIAICKEEGGIE